MSLSNQSSQTPVQSPMLVSTIVYDGQSVEKPCQQINDL